MSVRKLTSLLSVFAAVFFVAPPVGAQVIDNFSSGSASLFVFSGSGTDSQGRTGSGILGGSMTMELAYHSGTFATSEVTTSSETLDFVLNDADATLTLDYTFSGRDLTNLTLFDPTDAVRVRGVETDIPVTMDLTVTTDVGNSSTATVAIPGGITNEDFVVPFSSFAVTSGSGADFADADAIEVVMSASGTNNFVLDDLDLVPTVTATMSDSIAVGDMDGNADPGDTLRYFTPRSSAT